MSVSSLTIEKIQQVASSIEPHVVRTPVVPYVGAPVAGAEDADLFIKLELLQRGGSFKARGAINGMLNIENKANGVTAFSAGNHAIAVSYAARTLGLSAKVVMPETANPFRVERCRSLGAEVLFAKDVSALMDVVDHLQKSEGRFLIHPFEGEYTVQGTATVGLELCQDVEQLDVVIVPVGGGGLISGVASAVKQMQADCKVIGVEPECARGMADSIAMGTPMDKVQVNTIADSLGAPMHLPLTYSLVEHYVDELVQVSDDELRASMRFIFDELKMAVEPACAAAMAALRGPLKGRYNGGKVGLIACGSNIDRVSYNTLLG